LTGPAAGQGKNDGSVKGKSYFKSPPNCGLFVRKAALEERKLSKIEELRLRRELASTGIPSVSTTATTSSSTTNKAAAESKATGESSGSTTPTNRSSRLEELRQRRAAITPARGSEADQQAVKDITDKLKAKEEELSSLNEKLTSAEEQSKKALDKVLELEQDKVDLEEKLKARPVAPKEETPKSAQGPGDKEASSAEQSLKREKEALEEQLKDFQDKNQALTKQMEKMKAEHSTEITQLRSEASAYKNELQAITEQTNQRGVSDASHYKEKAQLQAQIAAIRREVQDLKNEKVEMESTLEDLALDKEQLQEEKESLEDRLEEVKLDADTSQMEAEELRTELEQAKAAAERAGSTAEMSAAAATTGGSAESDDMAQALSIQNARLREALIRLREQSSVEKMELTRKLKAAEKEAETNKSQLTENQELKKNKMKLEEEVGELKDMVEQGSAFEGMVEDLSDKVMEMEEQNVTLASTIRELEEAAELTSEMEEVQAEEIKAMSRDLEDRNTSIRNLEEAIKMYVLPDTPLPTVCSFSNSFSLNIYRIK
jgi:dynactin 1